MFPRALPALTLLLSAAPALAIDYSDHWCNGVAGTLTLRNSEFTSQGFSARFDETGARTVVGGQLAAVKVGAAGG